MKKSQHGALACLLALAALALITINSQAQDKVVFNSFVDADEVADTADGGGDAWGNWFGTAFYNATWDSSDASNNVNSGSLKVEAYFPDAGIGGQFGPQFLVINGFNGYTNSLYPQGIPGNGNGTPGLAVVTNVEFDIRFDPASAYDTNNNVWPWIEVGTRGLDTSADPWDFGYGSYSATNTNWYHRSIPITSSASWEYIPNIYFKHYNGSWQGGVYLAFYLDNITFTFMTNPAAGPSALPSLAVEKAKPSLRLLAGPSQYNRTQVASVNTNQSWVGGTYPVSYSFTVSGYDTEVPLNEFHMFLTPLSHVAGGVIDQWADYGAASNNLRLQITGAAAGSSTVYANLGWKTNLVNENPTNVVLNITNSTAIGTWTLTFSNANGGALTAPGASPAPFSLPAAVASTFANPVVAYFGVQPNPSAAIGQYVDLASIQTVGVASPGVPINSPFNSSSAPDTNIWRTASVSQDASYLVPVGSDSAYWLGWMAPDYGGALATAGPLTATNWKSPAYFTGYTSNAINKKLIGTRNWALLPNSAMPTVDGMSNSVAAPNGFFRLQLPAPAE